MVSLVKSVISIYGWCVREARDYCLLIVVWPAMGFACWAPMSGYGVPLLGLQIWPYHHTLASIRSFAYAAAAARACSNLSISTITRGVKKSFLVFAWCFAL